MARIDYLIQHPNEVEYADLDLLNTEILKYPYFYSLRALKLLALKKGNDLEFDKNLQLTAVYSSNRKKLYQFIHQEELTTESSVEDEINESPIDEQIQIESTNEVSETVVQNTLEELNPIKSIDELESVNKEFIAIENHTDEEVNLQVDHLNTDTEIQNSEFLTTENENSFDAIENNIEDEIILDDELNGNSDFTINEPTIESIIEEFKQHDFSIPETDNSLLEFDLPSGDEVNNLNQSVENSLQIAQQFLEETIEIETSKEIVEEEIKDIEIEQVSLINRASESIKENVNESLKPVSLTNAFQIQNTKNEIIGGFNFESTIEEKKSEVINDSTQKMEHVEENDLNFEQKIESNTSVEVTNLEKPVEQLAEISDDLPSNAEIKTIEKNTSVETAVPKDNALSFTDWLKLPQFQSENKPEKEIKYQIIDDFLEKNPKITPIKKQEIPESKNQVKEIKQTDFSDLMTETLAQIYIEQKQYEKAIRAYKILSLKYPEKNSLFAKQIKEIEILKNSK